MFLGYQMDYVGRRIQRTKDGEQGKINSLGIDGNHTAFEIKFKNGETVIVPARTSTFDGVTYKFM